jgi:hypothetical protein
MPNEREEKAMQFYWSLKSIPELSGLSPSERKRAWRAAYWRSYLHWQTWVSAVGVGLFMMIGSHLGALIGYQFVGGLIGAAVGGFVFGQVSAEFARLYIQTFLLSSQIEPRTPRN